MDNVCNRRLFSFPAEVEMAEKQVEHVSLSLHLLLGLLESESACVFTIGPLQADSNRSKLFTGVNAFMLIYFLTFNIYKYAFPLFLIYSFDNDDMKSSKRHVVLPSLIFLLKCLYKSSFITTSKKLGYFLKVLIDFFKPNSYWPPTQTLLKFVRPKDQ